MRANQAWRYTHDRLRKAYRLLERLSQARTLFTYLRREFTGLQIASTTNRIEGGSNAQLRLLLRAHRGMSEEHRKRAIEWHLYLHSEQPLPPAKLIQASHYRTAKTTPRLLLSRTQALSSTAPTSTPTQGSGPANVRQEAHDAPEIYTRFVL